MSRAGLSRRRSSALWLLFAGSALVAAASCSDGDSGRKVPSSKPGEAGEGGEAGAPGTSVGGESPGGAPAGGAAGQPELGLGGQPVAGAAGEGEAGAGGVPPLPVTIISANVNLSTDSLTTGRACAEAIAYSVLTLNGASATLATAPAAGCLSSGDELLVINLQGTATAHDNVGNWELLHVSTVTGTTVNFAANSGKFYGSAVTSNAGLGVTGTTQRVALIRVPHFGRLEIAAGATVTANAWNGVLGGVLAFRAAQLDLAGTIDVSALGYRAGRASMDDNGCSHSIQSEAGESISGSGSATLLSNVGASGGVGAGTSTFNGDNPLLATPGHAQAGALGANGKDRTLGDPGAAYGAADASKLTLGSGPGGALFCTATPTQATPYLIENDTGQAGGIALILADDVQLEDTGAISATPSNVGRAVAYSGGYVYLSGTTLALGQTRVSALGSVGSVMHNTAGAITNQASPGYIVLSAETVTGTTSPAAHWLGH